MSIIRNSIEAGSVSGSAKVSRAEDIIVQIDTLLRSVNLDIGGVDLLAVSRGPGSYTGIRIGLATGMGIARSVSVKLVEVSVLAAMAGSFSDGRERTAAVPFGKNEVALQSFTWGGEQPYDCWEPLVVQRNEFISGVALNQYGVLVLHRSVFELIPPSVRLDDPKIIDAGTNLARYIGLAAQQREEYFGSGPIYLQHSRAKTGWA